MESLDSHAFGNSSDSDEINEPATNMSLKQPRIYEKQTKSNIKGMASRKKGFDVIDAEELFHQMHNPFFDSWKSKKAKYVNYDKVQKIKKKRNLSSYRPTSFYKPDLGFSEKDKYYAKEVRTFDEVFKQIKHDQKRQEHSCSDDEFEAPLNDEYGGEYDYGEEMNDDQDIEGNDREILDDRILGILNIF